MGIKKEELLLTVAAGTITFLLMTFFIVLFLLIFKQRQRKHQTERKNLQILFQQTLLQTQLEIQEQTFKNISQEIHDNIGQVLSLTKLNINTMSDSSPDILEGKINDSRVLISKAIQDLRDLSRSLNTDYVVEMGLLRSVAYELELIKRTGTLETVLRVEGKQYRLQQQQELILFRIVQEILHNIIKHAKATLVDVLLQFGPEQFILIITDNGVGFDTSKLDTANYSGLGLGIRNMYHRAKMINAIFKLSSTPGKGVTVIMRLPVTLK